MLSGFYSWFSVYTTTIFSLPKLQTAWMTYFKHIGIIKNPFIASIVPFSLIVSGTNIYSTVSQQLICNLAVVMFPNSWKWIRCSKSNEIKKNTISDSIACLKELNHESKIRSLKCYNILLALLFLTQFQFGWVFVFNRS